MLKLAQYPAMLTAAAEGEAPHDVTFYLRELAASYHSYYDAERILVDDETVKKARLALVAATAIALDLPLDLGLPAKEVALLALTLLLTSMTLSGGRATILQGAVHLVVFAVFVFLAMVP